MMMFLNFSRASLLNKFCYFPGAADHSDGSGVIADFISCFGSQGYGTMHLSFTVIFAPGMISTVAIQGLFPRRKVTRLCCVAYHILKRLSSVKLCK